MFAVSIGTAMALHERATPQAEAGAPAILQGAAALLHWLDVHAKQKGRVHARPPEMVAHSEWSSPCRMNL